jgi:hypothetical protein
MKGIEDMVQQIEPEYGLMLRLPFVCGRGLARQAAAQGHRGGEDRLCLCQRGGPGHAFGGCLAWDTYGLYPGRMGRYSPVIRERGRGGSSRSCA